MASGVEGGPRGVDARERSQLRAFNAKHDVDRMLGLQNFLETDSPAYQEKLDQELQLVDTNISSFVAEMCGVEVYRKKYSLIDGKLVGEGTDVPMELIIQRGIEKGFETCNREDLDRMEAELEQFQDLQNLVQDAIDAQEKRTFILPSPKGSVNSVFKYNFVDFFTVSDDGSVELKRRNSNQSTWQMAASANLVSGERIFGPETTTLDLKRRAVEARPQLSEADLFRAFGTGSYKTSREGLEYVLERVSPAAEEYKVSLQQIPPDEAALNFWYRSMVNVTTKALDRWQRRGETSIELFDPLIFDIYTEGNRPMTPFFIPCGLVGEDGFGFTGTRTYNATDYASQHYGPDEDSRGTLWVQCETKGCLKRYKRQKDGPLEKKCKYCGNTKGVTC